MNSREQRLGFRAGLSLHGLRHHRRGCPRNRTAASLKARVDHSVNFQLQPQRERVTAERVVPLHDAIVAVHDPIITWPAAALPEKSLASVAPALAENFILHSP